MSSLLKNMSYRLSALEATVAEIRGQLEEMLKAEHDEDEDNSDEEEDRDSKTRGQFVTRIGGHCLTLH